MDLEYARSLSYKEMRNLFKEYLQSQELGRNTVGTVTGDSFYLWNNEGKDVFWDTVLSDQFEEEARKQITDALTRHSTGNVSALINGYVSSLRRFRNYVFSSDSVKIPEKDDMTALKDFLLDIDCLEPLSEWTGKFNLFDILKISRVEIRHSNMLAWLINPSENHGLGDGVIRGIIQFVTTNMDDQDTFDNLLMDCHDFSVQREWHHIDLLAVSESNKFLVCIENKIDSGEHDNQLSRYRQQVIDSFPGYKHMFVYLSPEGNESSDPDSYKAYQGMCDNVLLFMQNGIVEFMRKHPLFSIQFEGAFRNTLNGIEADYNAGKYQGDGRDDCKAVQEEILRLRSKTMM